MYKKIIFIAVVIIIVAAAGVGFYVFHAKAPAQNQTSATQQEITIEDKKITDSTKPFKIDITYPYIAGLDGFNAKVQEIITSETNDFKKNSLDNDNAVKQTDPADYAKYPREYDLNISYEKGEVDADVVSIMFSVYNFEGGAHGNSYFIPVNYDVVQKKEIALADMFAGQPDYLKKVSDYCTKDLTKQLTDRMGNTDGGWISDGAGPKEENFQAFLITKDSLVFYFPPYQIAPYVAGDFKVVMPR